MATLSTNGLTPKQQKAIVALLSEATVKGAAKKAGVGERTIHTWLTDASFRIVLSAAEGAAIDAATRRLVGLQDAAIDLISVILQDERAPVGVRLRAAQAVLDYLLKLRELRNVEARLVALEQAYGQPGER